MPVAHHNHISAELPASVVELEHHLTGDEKHVRQDLDEVAVRELRGEICHLAAPASEKFFA